MLQALALQYETPDFLLGDPSWFMHQVKGDRNQETIAFIAASLSYGSRKQFMPKIQVLLDHSQGEPFSWVKERRYESLIPNDDSCFYRLNTNSHLRQLLDQLADVFGNFGSLKALIATASSTDSIPSKDSIGSIPSKDSNPSNLSNHRKLEAIEIIQTLTQTFSSPLIPHSTASACKRLCMFLRWMVRDNSPVDLGIWSDIIDKRTLIMPLDTHVMQQANRLGLITTKTTSMATAKKLTAAVAKIFPDDPLRADFALFGYGVTSGKSI